MKVNCIAGQYLRENKNEAFVTQRKDPKPYLLIILFISSMLVLYKQLTLKDLKESKVRIKRLDTSIISSYRLIVIVLSCIEYKYSHTLHMQDNKKVMFLVTTKVFETIQNTSNLKRQAELVGEQIKRIIVLVNW